MVTRFLFLLLFCFSACTFSKKEQPIETGKLNSSSPSGMVWIPGGEFMMGGTEEKPAANAQSVHKVKVDGFWMDETEVTNAQFKIFVDSTHYKTVAERPLDWEELKKTSTSRNAKTRR